MTRQRIKGSRRDANLTMTMGDELATHQVPWCWVTTSDLGERKRYDFAALCEVEGQPVDRQALFHYLNLALYRMAQDTANYSFYYIGNLYASIRQFQRYLTETDPQGTLTTIEQVDFKVLDRYVHWVCEQRIRYGARSGRKVSASTKVSSVAGLISVLKALAPLAPEAISEDVRRGHFPTTYSRGARDQQQPRESYTLAESRTILAACKDVIDQDRCGTWDGTDLHVLAAAMVILLFRTIGNLAPMLRLHRDSMLPHPADPKRYVLVCRKRRAGHKIIKKAFDAEHDSDKTAHYDLMETTVRGAHHAKALFDYLVQRSDAFRANAPSGCRDSIWLYRNFVNRHTRLMITDRIGVMKQSHMACSPSVLPALAERYGLKDRYGEPLAIHVSRIRPTGLQLIDEISEGEKGITQRLANHASQQTTLDRYLVVNDRMRAGLILVQTLLSQFARSSEGCSWAAHQLARHFDVPLENALRLLDGQQQTHLASCADLYFGQYAPKTGTAPCADLLACFKCKHMTILETDLYKLFSFRNALVTDFQRGRLPVSQWIKRYQWIVQLIDNEIANDPVFSPRAVRQAQRRARDNPYPLWRDDLLLATALRHTEAQQPSSDTMIEAI